jgi:hypothetical protein
MNACWNFIFAIELLAIIIVLSLIFRGKTILKEKPDGNTNGNTKRHAKIILATGFISIIVAPFIFTRNGLTFLDFTETGQIGDTIGGITAPFINMAGAILLYYTLMAQINANKTTQEQITTQHEIDDINQLYNNLKDDIDKFRYESYNNSTNNKEETGKDIYIGSDAICRLFNDLYCHGACNFEEYKLKTDTKITELENILRICKLLSEKINSSETPNKNIIKELTKYQIEYRIMPGLCLLEKDGGFGKKYCEECSEEQGRHIEHGLSDEMVCLIDDIRRLNNLL